MTTQPNHSPRQSNPVAIGPLPADRAGVVVLDEMPYVVGEDPGFEGALQKGFDRQLHGCRCC